MSACESKTVTINGATWTELNSNLYQRSLDECYVPPTEQQRNWSTCGGQQNMDDSVPLSGHVLGLPDGIQIGRANGDYSNQGFVDGRGCLVGYKTAGANRTAISTVGFTQTEGATMDSGLCTRMHNFFDQIVKSDNPDNTEADARIYTLEIKAPISGSLFNDLWGANNLARSDPRNRLALGLPHINSGQVVLQFKDLFKRLIRRLGRPNTLGAIDKRLGRSPYAGGDVIITMNEDYTPNLRLTYIRLPAWRTMPQSVALNVTRREIRRAQGSRAAKSFGDKQFAAGLFDGSANVYGLRCSSDVNEFSSALSIRPPSRNVKDGTKDVLWNGVMFPQPPSYIFICYEKDPEFMSYDNPIQAGLRTVAIPAAGGEDSACDAFGVAAAARGPADANAWNARIEADDQKDNTLDTVSDHALMSRYIAQNQDSNAAILQLEIVIQSAIGSFAFRDTNKEGNKTYLTDRDILWRTHTRNCHSEYAKKGRSAWQRRKSCLLLSSSDYLLGLSTSPGTVYPITMDVRVKFANLASYKGGVCYTLGRNKGQAEFEDFMVGEPILVGLFTQNVLSLAASSAVYSSQAFSQATTAAALAS